LFEEIFDTACVSDDVNINNKINKPGNTFISFVL